MSSVSASVNSLALESELKKEGFIMIRQAVQLFAENRVTLVSVSDDQVSFSDSRVLIQISQGPDKEFFERLKAVIRKVISEHSSSVE